jgi:hypothetical protein
MLHRAAASSMRRPFAVAVAAAAAAASTLCVAHTAGTPVRAQAATSQSPQSQQQLSSLSVRHYSSAPTAALFSHATTAALSAAPSSISAVATPSSSRSAVLLLDPSESPVPNGAPGAEGALAAAEEAAAGSVMSDAQARQCDEWKHKAIHQSRKVNFLFRALKRAGCQVDPLTFIHCTACDSNMNGALFHDVDGYTAVSPHDASKHGQSALYLLLDLNVCGVPVAPLTVASVLLLFSLRVPFVLSYAPQTLMCGNRVRDYRTFETVLTHELIHAYDHCRAEVDVTNLQHHACMEVRAASLSGDCTFREEAKLGNLVITGQQPVSGCRLV